MCQDSIQGQGGRGKLPPQYIRASPQLIILAEPSTSPPPPQKKKGIIDKSQVPLFLVLLQCCMELHALQRVDATVLGGKYYWMNCRDYHP
jgi:hypothetical protein